MSELDEFKKVVSPIAYGLAYKSKLGTTEYQQLYTEEDVIKYFNNKPSLTIPKSIADKLDKDDANNKTVLDWVFATEMIVINDEKELKRREDEILRRRAIVSIYGASKALGVELVKVV